MPNTTAFWDDPALIYNPPTNPNAAGTPTTIGPTGNPNYSVNPAPTTGQGPFGAVPGPVGLPNPAGDLSKVYPNLTGTNQAVSSNILSQLGGQLSPGTLKMMQDAEAAQAIRGGMPGTNMQRNTLFGNRSVRDLGLTAEGQVQKGLDNYNRTIPTVSGTQTVNPALQNEVAMWNSINRSAPDPTEAGNYAKFLFDRYLNQMRGGGSRSGSPAGGTGQFAPPSRPDPTWQELHPGLAPGFGPGGQPDASSTDAGAGYDPVTGLYIGTQDDPNLGYYMPTMDENLLATTDTGAIYDPYLGE